MVQLLLNWPIFPQIILGQAVNLNVFHRRTFWCTTLWFTHESILILHST